MATHCLQHSFTIVTLRKYLDIGMVRHCTPQAGKGKRMIVRKNYLNMTYYWLNVTNYYLKITHEHPLGKMPGQHACIRASKVCMNAYTKVCMNAYTKVCMNAYTNS